MPSRVALVEYREAIVNPVGDSPVIAFCRQEKVLNALRVLGARGGQGWQRVTVDHEADAASTIDKGAPQEAHDKLGGAA
jgi:hypothetical protein